MSDVASQTRNGLYIYHGTNTMAAGTVAPNRQGSKGRKCSVCSTVLSIYNRADTCYAHTPPKRDLSKRNTVVWSPWWNSHGTKDMRRAGCCCRECMEALGK